MIQKHLEKLIIGAAVAVAASVLLPVVKKNLPNLVNRGRNGAAELARKTKSSVSLVREEVEDIIAEAQFERMRKQMDREIGIDTIEIELSKESG